jgi:hypothetical protein
MEAEETKAKAKEILKRAQNAKTELEKKKASPSSRSQELNKDQRSNVDDNESGGGEEEDN